ncbi:hypothetical protein HY994_00205 [Candidatus Micrarchaeota archaeon]|nr:hypothetical protein [Candidatus Micrarchaeota archaeon]
MRAFNSVVWDALKFLGKLGVVTMAAYGLFVLTPLQNALAAYTAHATAFLLYTLGKPVAVVFLQNPHLQASGFDAELIALCWGTLELALWAGIVLSTDNRSWDRRLKGLSAGTLGFLVFNPVRIALSLWLFDASEPFASSIAHDVLFRISLLALFVVSYFIWYEWPEKKGRRQNPAVHRSARR